MRNDGKSGLVDQTRVDALTKLASEIDRKFGDLLLKAADLRNEINKEEVDDTISLIEDLRIYTKEDVHNADTWAESMLNFLDPTTGTRDHLGFSEEQ